MRKVILSFLISVFTIGSLMSQPISNFIFFSEDGLPFYVIMNGIKQNDNAQTNVLVAKLTAPSYKVKIIFEDKTIPSINKNVYTKPGIEVTYRIKKNRKGENVLRYYTENPISYEPVKVVHNEDNTNVVVIHEDASYDNNSEGINIDVNINEGGINIDTPDGGVNINANIDINGADAQYSESYEESSSNYYVEDNLAEQTYHMPGYSGNVGCNWPMNNGDFQRAKHTIENTDFSSDKLTIAKQIVGSNCLTAQQVKELVNLFDFESTKLEFAKHAYTHTFDIGNYYIVNDAFDFSSSIKKLDEYIKSVRW